MSRDEASFATNDSADIGDAILFSLRGEINAGERENTESDALAAENGRLYGLLSRLRGSGRVFPPTPEG